NDMMYGDGYNVNVQQASFAATAVIDLQGKNITLEAVNGSDSTFIDGEGDYTALDMDAGNDDYEGYASSTEFIGFTFKDGPDDAPLIKIVGPDISSSLDWAPTFTNCRFIDSEVSADDDDGGSVDMYVAPVVIKNAEPVFDGCEFRDLHVEPNSNYNNDKIYGPIRLYGIWGGDATEDDTTAFRPQFKNCVIAENSLKRGSFNESSSLSMRGGAVYVAFGVIPYFENTRIDSNTVDFVSSLNDTTGEAYGGGIYLDNYLSRGEYIKFVNCSISHNSALGEAIAGGGIYVRCPAVELVNCILVNNSIDGSYTDESEYTDAQGGAICYRTDIYAYEQDGNPSHDPELRIVNSTIADNSISNIATGYDNGVVGAGISRDNTNNNPVTIFNSIIYNNEIEGYLESENFRMNLGQFNGVSAFDDDNALIDYSIIEYFSETNLEEDDLLDTDPGFVGSGDYTLSDASVAIGAGTDEYENIDAPAFDYNNEARPGSGGGNPDLGAFEHEFSTTPYPAKPQNLTVDSEGDSTVTISWTANTEDDLSKYRIYYGASAAATLLDSVSGTPSYSATGLDNYTTYYFAVSAVDLDGYESAKSNEVSGEPKWFGPNWYVDTDNGSSSGDGSPATPFREIQDAIDAVDPLSRTDGLIDTILVLPGTYDRSDDQQLYFKYTSGTNEGNPKNLVLKSRDGAATTILDGENKRVFEIVDGTDTTLQIIGFTITASNGGEDDGDGSVIKIHGEFFWMNTPAYIFYSGATFKNCLIKDVDGEDAAVEVEYANAVFIGCELSNNTADYSNGDGLGGAVRVGNSYSEGGSTVHFYRSRLVNNTITTSSANYINGGAIWINASNNNDVKLVNTIVAGNSVLYNNSDDGYPPSGGGIYLSGGALLLINCTLVDNQIRTNTNNASAGGSAIRAIQNWNNPDSDDPPQLTIFNSIVYDNFITTSAATNPNTSFTGQISIDDMNGAVDVYASYSLIGGDDDLGGDEILLNTNPEFADSTYVLHERSPAIGAGETVSENVEGDDIYAPANDLAGNARPNPADSNPDLGAYEHELAVTPYPSPVTNLMATPLHRSIQLDWLYAEDEDVEMYIA
ncbi:MAG: choice-of-anchor Q domain-containing protein, partial [Candidatus Marinimicrobia bacterium]|nr:choice-of-anchor Q domain-containing protein [Candidatus Neomarinimicrobiota bacterium]